MSKHPQLSLAMSQIIAADAPLLSPVSADSNWDQPLFSPHDQPFFPFYALPPSPAPASPVPMLKMRLSPDADCIPTHQLFANAAPTDDALLHDDDAFSSGMSSCGAKRSASPAPSATKKRAVGERISSKDFIPPDVSGLSKREARLVKNRAAAFLSRQRKREEFECMEVRVQELEQENARLLALTQNALPPSSDPQSEVEQLRAQLALANERTRALSAQLASAPSDISVKQEATDPPFSSLASPPRPSPATPSQHKSGASLGLMVLLCALPTLLSMRMQSTAPTSFSIPNPFSPTHSHTHSHSHSSSFDYSANGYLPPNHAAEYDWTKSGLMELDERHNRPLPASSAKLEFAGTDADAPGLGDLDISFDTVAEDDGKIRVRIHPSSGTRSGSGSRAQSPGAASTTSSSSSGESESSLAMWSGAPSTHYGVASASSSSLSSLSSSSSEFAYPSSPTSPTSPSSASFSPFGRDGALRYPAFGMHQSQKPQHQHQQPQVYGQPPAMDEEMFGVGMGMGMGASYDEEFGIGMGWSGVSPVASMGFGMGLGAPFSSAMETSVSTRTSTGTKGEKRRVRIALKSMPEAGGEGGEWEVQIC